MTATTGAPAATEVGVRQLLRIATAGSVDDGKSTLIGRLLHDTDSLPLDHLVAVTDDDGVADLAALSDGLRAEREQGITIDVAYRFFATETRSYILADTPGHERYTRNMFTGASNAHVAILLVDARSGVLRQTRRHARIATVVGVDRLVATVNKIDLIDYDEARFREVEAELHELGRRLGTPITVIPIAALSGDNVVHRSGRTPWYTGPTLLSYLETIELDAPAADAHHLRLPVQWVSRPTDGTRRRYTGRLSAGTLTVGDHLLVLPSNSTTTVTALDTLDPTRTTAVAPLSVSIEIADDIDIARGDTIVSGLPEAELPVVAREIDATVCWMGDRALRTGDMVALKHTTRTVRATVGSITSRLDPETLDEHPEPGELVLNDIARITLRTSAPVVVDPYADNRDAGSFVLIDEHTNDTVGAGIVLGATGDSGDPVDAAAPRHSPGVTVWLSGAASARTAALAAAIVTHAGAAGRAAHVLGGSSVHALVGTGDQQAEQLAHLARVLTDAGVLAVIPAPEITAAARAVLDAAGVDVVTVHAHVEDHPDQAEVDASARAVLATITTS